MVASVRSELDRALDPHLDRPGPYAVVGYPLGRNVGEYLMWLGITDHLRRRDIWPVYTCDRTQYAPERVAAHIGRHGTILITGGGNLGDLWPHEQRFRERVIEDFPDARIVQLPQSMHFRRAEHLERAQKVYALHPDLTLLVRDPVSHAAAQEAFGRCRTELCPDVAFGVPSAPPADSAPRGILWLARGDQESRHPPGRLPDEVRRWDWAVGHGRPFAWGLARRFGTTVVGDARRLRHPALAGAGNALVGGAGVRLARGHLARGAAMLGGAEVVVTDRFHGHILAVLLGRPQVVLDNGDGKVHAFVRRWTGSSPRVHVATSAAEALEKATALLDSTS